MQNAETKPAPSVTAFLHSRFFAGQSAFVLIALLALAIRLPQLGERPMHTDESINAYIVGQLLAGENFHYDPKDRQRVMAYLQERQSKGEVVTGVLYVDETIPDMHEMSNTPDMPLTEVPYEKLCPGADALSKLQEEYR